MVMQLGVQQTQNQCHPSCHDCTGHLGHLRSSSYLVAVLSAAGRTLVLVWVHMHAWAWLYARLCAMKEGETKAKTLHATGK
jgi:hypothetical protein